MGIGKTQSDRFGGIARLYGEAGLRALGQAHVCVVGVGGVGSWTVEALARSGVGGVTLVDLDEVCVTNVNRQLPALDGGFGKFKVEELAKRVAAINPDCRVRARAEFFNDKTSGAILEDGFDYVVDAIDNVSNKARLIADCRERGIPVITSGAAGGRRDGTRAAVADLSKSTNDPLLSKVRVQLRRDHGFPREGKRMGVPCVFLPGAAGLSEDGWHGVRQSQGSGGVVIVAQAQLREGLRRDDIRDRGVRFCCGGRGGPALGRRVFGVIFTA